jgi:HTH-type transcriptional regulator/antitoxin MqsA
MKGNICSICGKGTLKKEVIEEKLTYKGETLTIPDYIIYKCDLCNEEIVDKGTLKSSGKLLKNFKCKVDGLLTGNEIKEIRKKVGFTQEQMSEILGGGLKSFARYESGQICQSRAMDNLLRILDRYPQVVHFIQKKTREQSVGLRNNLKSE